MRKQSPKESKKIEALDKLIEEITVDAYGDDEQLWAFRQVFEDDVALPADGFVIGIPVSVIAVAISSRAIAALFSSLARSLKALPAWTSTSCSCE